ncbi:DUF4112 domain-containing protein [Pseudooceanicola sp. MF1-13]|uniref:DUF4112 domain-containing protein n=1 Tax=Pseudooceanicola sp. MF1-13 TaxID=3379095 RepID=UPI0038920077
MNQRSTPYTHPTLDKVDRIARVMDRAVRIPGTSIRMGLDSIIGWVPGVGDTLTLAPSLYIIELARREGVPGHKLARMLGNIGVDWLIGLVPLIGDIFDIGWKSNTRNAALLRDHIEGRIEKGRALRDAA